VGAPGSFEAAFHSTLTVPSAGEVTFNIYSDDGWLLGIGTNVSGLQPSYVSGALDNPQPQTPVYHLTVVGAHNLPTSPAQRTVTINFPAAGTYPMELDYTECCGGQLSLVLGSSFRNPIPPTQPSTQRKIVFVHGIRADFRKIIAGNDYSGMTTMLQNDYRDVSVFPYYQDVGYAQS